MRSRRDLLDRGRAQTTDHLERVDPVRGDVEADDRVARGDEVLRDRHAHRAQADEADHRAGGGLQPDPHDRRGDDEPIASSMVTPPDVWSGPRVSPEGIESASAVHVEGHDSGSQDRCWTTTSSPPARSNVRSRSIKGRDMKALQLHGHRDIRLDDVPDPRPRDGWTVVEVLRSSICHSDLREWDGPTYIGRTGEPNPLTGVHMPVILGHEFVGRIVEISGEAPGYEVGDRVAPDACVYDGTCWYCRHGRYNLCESIAVLGFDGHGSFAHYVAVPNYALNHLPDSVSDDDGALIEPLAVAVHGVRQGNASVGDVIAVVGAGMIGLCAAQVAHASGASEVFVSEPMTSRRERARALGVTVLDPSSEDAAAAIRERTGGRGADVVIDCVGTEGSLNSALSLARKGGRISLVASTRRPDRGHRQDRDRRTRARGSLAYAYDFPRAIALVRDGRVRLEASSRPRSRCATSSTRASSRWRPIPTTTSASWSTRRRPDQRDRALHGLECMSVRISRSENPARACGTNSAGIER